MLYFEKSQPAPTCLQTEKNYRCSGVLEQLRIDFKDKCYICECKNPTVINVEHFKPHRGDNILKLDWSNLFWSCGHCNNTKLAKPEYDSILNCTDLTDDVEQQLKYEFKPFPHEKVSISAVNQQNTKAINTKNLLNAVFNGTTTLKNIEADNLRKQLLKEIKNYQDYLISYDEACDEEDKHHSLRKIKSHLNSGSAFTSFKRQIIKDNPELLKEFGSYCN